MNSTGDSIQNESRELTLDLSSHHGLNAPILRQGYCFKSVKNGTDARFGDKNKMDYDTWDPYIQKNRRCGNSNQRHSR